MTLLRWIRVAASTCCALSLSVTPVLAAERHAGAADNVASSFKAPNDSTPPSVARRWVDEDAELWSYVESNVPSILDHTGNSAFDEHLRGVQSVLRGWNSPDHIVKAGLFHSLYGTEGFQGFSLPLSERGAIRDLIGERAERLCWIFCMVDRMTVDESAIDWTAEESCGDGEEDRVLTFSSRAELGRFSITVGREEWLDFLELTLADWLEQVEGASFNPSDLFLWRAGESYAYRRDAYAAMSELLARERQGRLGEVVPRMHRAVYGTERNDTRHLVQPRTPPMSEAAARALEALRSAGEAIPVNLRPVGRERLD